MTRYEPLLSPRFKKDVFPGGYEFSIPARKSIFALLFLPFWLLGWSAGGIAAMVSFIETHEPFLAIWLVMWAIGWLFAAGTIAYMLTGRDVIRCAGGDLECGWQVLMFSRTKTYRGSEIRKLSTAGQSDWFSRMAAWQGAGGPFARGRFGSIRFDYGARTIYLAPGLDPAEAELIIADLLRSIPGAA